MCWWFLKGYENKEDISDDNRILLGNYRYDNESHNSLQFFDAQYHYPDKPIAVIELKIESNAGNKEYTCLYKFRVHGRLFKNVNDRESTVMNDKGRSEDNEQHPQARVNLNAETSYQDHVRGESSSSSKPNN